MMFCLNLCEIFTDEWIKNDYLGKVYKHFCQVHGLIKRIYVGSSFCSQYFIKFRGYKKLLEFCRNQHIAVTLVLPVFSEKNIDSGKQKVSEIISYACGIVDEITVNDLGTLWWIHSNYNIRINIGRLFSKDPRDCRIPEYCNLGIQPFFLTNIGDAYWGNFDISSVELDPTNRVIDIYSINDMNIEIGLHMPYCYMTTGNICKFASIHRSIEQKFRPNLSCSLECMHISDTYSGHINQTDCDPILFRFGRTLYYKVNDLIELSTEKSTRIIYFPIDEWRDIRDENFDSLK